MPTKSNHFPPLLQNETNIKFTPYVYVNTVLELLNRVFVKKFMVFVAYGGDRVEVVGMPLW